MSISNEGEQSSGGFIDIALAVASPSKQQRVEVLEVGKKPKTDNMVDPRGRPAD